METLALPTPQAATEAQPLRPTTEGLTGKEIYYARRDFLKKLSKQVKPLIESGEFENVNEAIKALYAEQGHTDLKTFNQWKKEGKSVKKGSKALIVWGKPLERQADSDNPESEANDEDSKGSYWPITYLFSALMVEDREKVA